MADHDTNPLGPLVGGPVPPLADPAAVRGRGEQRRRRQRAVVGAAGVLLVGTLVGAVALVGGGGDDAGEDFIVPPVVTATATASPSPSAPPVTTTPATTPPTSTSTSPASPSAGPLRIPAAALVEATDLPRSDAWIRRASSRDAAGEPSVVDPCGTEQKTSSAGRVGFLSGSYVVEDPSTPGEAVPESGGVFQAVSRFSSAAAAQAAYDALVVSVQRCPSRTVGASTTERTVLRAGTGLVVSEVAVDPPYPFPVYYGATLVGDLVSVWELNPGEGVDDAGARQVSDLVRTALCAASGTC